MPSRSRALVIDRSAPIGIMLALPGLYFAFAAIADAYAGVGFFFIPFSLLLDSPVTRGPFNLLSPLVFLGGPLLALVLNVLYLVRIDLYRYGQGLRGTISIAFRRSNLLVASVALAGGGLLFAYALIENLSH